MTLQFEVFRSRVSTWDKLFEDASRFATEIGKARLVTITTSAGPSSTTGRSTLHYQQGLAIRPWV